MDKWHGDVEQFKLKAFGMSDYNCYDVILGENGHLLLKMILNVE